MSMKRNLAAVAFAALVAAPLPAQIVVRSDSTIHERIEAARRRVEAARARTATDSARRTGRGSSRIPPGQLPPKGMCRVWIDGVPPGQQPPVTDCATAERTRTANSRVIYGDRESFPGNGNGNGKGKFKDRRADRETSRRCSVRDGVVVGGRVINVCSDSTLQRDRDRRGRGRFEADDEDNDDDHFENQDRGGHEKLAKSERKAAKAARKGNRGRG